MNKPIVYRGILVSARGRELAESDLKNLIAQANYPLNVQKTSHVAYSS
ncbi:hypothetical protein [Vulcanisaeta sp. JCM 16159]|nr:hypothetical protein [Vulcanisaeta sp. JCM 16159]